MKDLNLTKNDSMMMFEAMQQVQVEGSARQDMLRQAARDSGIPFSQYSNMSLDDLYIWRKKLEKKVQDYRCARKTR